MSGEREQPLDPVLEVRITPKNLSDLEAINDPAEKERRTNDLIKNVNEQGRKTTLSAEKVAANIAKDPTRDVNGSGDAQIAKRFTANILQIAKFPELLKKLIPGDNDRDRKRRDILIKIADVNPDIGTYSLLNPFLQDIITNPDSLKIAEDPQTGLTEFEKRFANLSKYDKNSADIFKKAITPALSSISPNKSTIQVEERLGAIQVAAAQSRDTGQLTSDSQSSDAIKRLQREGAGQKTRETKAVADFNNLLGKITNINESEIVADYLYASLDPFKSPEEREKELNRIIQTYQEKYANVPGSKQAKIKTIAEFEAEFKRILTEEDKVNNPNKKIFTPPEIEEMKIGAIEEIKAEVKDPYGTLSEVQNIEPIIKILEEELKPDKLRSILFSSEPVRNPDGSLGGVRYKLNTDNAKSVQKSVSKIISLLSEKFTTSVQGDNPNDVYNEGVEGRVLRIVTSQLTRLTKSSSILGMLDVEGRKEFTRFVNDDLIRYADIRKTYQTLFYVYPFILDKTPEEKWGGYLEKLKMTDIHKLVSVDPLISDLSAAWKKFIQGRVRNFDNRMPTDLGLTTTAFEFEAEARRILIARGQEHLLDEMPSIAYLVRGITLLTSEQQDIYALSQPMVGSVGDKMFRNLVADMNIRHKWGVEEGFKLIAKPHQAALYNLRIDKNEFKENWFKSLLKGTQDGYIPAEVAKEAKRWFKDAEGLSKVDFHNKMVDFLETNGLSEDDTWLNAIKRLGLGGVLDRGGYATSGLRKEYERDPDLKRAWGGSVENWDKVYEWYQKEAGVAFGFLFGTNRASEESDMYLKQMLKMQGDLNFDQSTKFDSYKKNGKNRKEAKMSVTIDGYDETWTYNEYFGQRLNALRGESFYHLLKKDPLSYINDMYQMMPAFGDGYIQLDGSNEIKKASDFYFDMRLADRLSPADLQKRNKVLSYVRTRFGFGNIDHVKKIMDFHSDLYTQFNVETKDGPDKGKSKGEIKSGEDIKNARDRARKVLDLSLSMAHLNAKNEKRGEVTAQDIYNPKNIERLEIELATKKSKGESDKELSELIVDLKEAQKISELLLGNNGLTTHFKRYVGDEKNHFGNGAKNLGVKHGFFQETSAAFFEKDNNMVLPPGDINYDMWFNKDVGWEADNAIPRRMNDYKPIHEIQQAVLDLPKKLKSASYANPGDPQAALKEVMEVHAKVKELESYIDTDYGREINYYVAYATSRYFQMEYRTRIPLFGRLFQTAEGKNVALSTIHGDRDAMTMTSDSLREYIRNLRIAGFIPQEGQFSEQMLYEKLGIEMSKFAFMEVIPNATTALILFLIATYLNDALQEATGKNN